MKIARRSSRRHVCGAAIVWGLLFVTVPARASPDDAAFVVSLDGCEEIDRALLLSLLELELSDVAPTFRDGGPPFVELQCVGQRLHVRVRDPVTGKSVARTVPRPSGGHGERSVALAVSQLFLTSWLELLLPEPSRPALPDRPAGEYAAVARRVRASLAEAPVIPGDAEERAPPFVVGLTVLGGAGVRDVEAPIVTEALSLRLHVSPDVAWGLGVDVGLDHGAASRERGDVELWLGHVTLGAGATLVREGRFTLQLGASGGVVWGRLAGHPSDAGVRGDAVEGIGARLVATTTASLTLDWLVLSLALDLGVDLGLPVGGVSAEQAVTAGGFFGRGLLGVGVRFGD